MSGASMIREVTMRQTGRKRAAPAAIRNPEDAAQYVQRRIGSETREHFLAIYLDARHRPIADSIVHVGTLDQSLIHPREIFRPAVALGAVACICAHNHPSGDATPSSEDREVHARLVQAGAYLGIQVLDSLVVSADSWRKVS